MTTKRRVRENSEYLAMAVRLIRAAGRRLGDNPDDLASLAAIQTVLDDALRVAVHQARDQYGLSWAEVGSRLGVTRQAAQQRFAGSSRPGDG